ncbi:hypothetical protein HDU99_009629 [Rhizoclosmatium hyalinum]|nr:hypothetical protein HDU99_009629 [Rhizoclosmatium hyalinum]
MERIGFERSFGDTRAPVVSASPAETNVTSEPTALVEKGAPFRKNTLSKLVIPTTPVKQESVPLQFDTLFDANVEFLGTGEFVETPELLTANTDFFVTPTSAQISKDIIYEPEALLLTPLSRPGSNKTLDEDEEDREQAKAWISSGLEGRFF